MYLKQIFNTKKIIPLVLFVAFPALLFYSISLLTLNTAGFKILEILRDPAQQTGQSSFLGFVSNIGVWLWVSSAAICFFIVAAGKLAVKDGYRTMLVLIGILSMLLAIDDFFMIHDRYLSQRVCVPFYAAFVGILLVRYHKKILEIDGFSFLLAGLLLAMSVFTDLTQRYNPLGYTASQIFEEGFKFVGGATWLYFSSLVAVHSLLPPPATDQLKDNLVEEKIGLDEVLNG